MATLNTNAAVQFKAGFEYLLAQTSSKFRPLITVENFSNAEQFYVNQIGSAATLTAVADPTVASVYSSITTSRRLIEKAYYPRNEFVSNLDLNNMNFDPKADIVKRVMEAYARTMDSVVIAAAVGTAKTGKTGGTNVTFPAGNILAHGSTGATYAKILTGLEFFLGKNFEGQELSWVVGPRQATELLNINNIINADFSRIQGAGITTPMTSGYLTTLNLGVKVNVYVSTLLPVATNVRDTLLFAKGGIALGVGKEVSVEILKNPSNNAQPQITTEAIFGATRLDEDQVYMIRCQET